MPRATPLPSAFISTHVRPTCQAQTSWNVLQGPSPPHSKLPKLQRWCSVVRGVGLTQTAGEERKLALKVAWHSLSHPFDWSPTVAWSGGKV